MRRWVASASYLTSGLATDLTQHAQFSGEKLEWKDPQTGEAYVPHVIEPAAGVGRAVLALLCDAYDTDELGGEKRTVLRLHPATAPVKVAVLPLLRKDGHPEKAREIYEALRPRMAGRRARLRPLPACECPRCDPQTGR